MEAIVYIMEILLAISGRLYSSRQWIICLAGTYNFMILLQGRNPFYVEPAMVICITDGCKLSGQGGIQDEVIIL